MYHVDPFYQKFQARVPESPKKTSFMRNLCDQIVAHQAIKNRRQSYDDQSNLYSTFYNYKLIMPDATSFEIYFSNIHQLGSHQSDSSASSLLQQIIHKLKKDVSHFSRLIQDEGQRKQFHDKVQAIDKFLSLFYCQFGCALVLHQKQLFSPISASLVFPKQWDFNIYVKKQKVSYIADFPATSASFEIGQLGTFYSSLQQAKDGSRNLIAQILKEQENVRWKKYKDKDRKNHHTPSFLLQIVKQAIRRKEKEDQLASSKTKQEEKKQPQEILSKGGTLDVGTHTGTTKANTSLSVVISILEHLLQNTKITKIIMLDQKIEILSNLVAKQKGISLQKYKVYSQCLDEVAHILKTCVNQEIKFDEGYFIRNIQSLSLNLSKIYEPSHSSSISINQFVQSVDQATKPTAFAFSTIIKYDPPGTQTFKPAGSLGFSKSLSQIRNFKDLLSKKEIFPQSDWFIIVQGYFFSIATQAFKTPNMPVKIDIEQIKCLPHSLSPMHQIIYAYGNIIKSKEKANNYGMKLTNQSYSHYYLIRYIGAAIAFEVVGQERRNRKANLEEYRCPQAIQLLYQNFYSLSYEARIALEAMFLYFSRNKNKKQMFTLQQSNKSYYDFVNLLADQDQSIKNWIILKKNEVDKKINTLDNEFRKFGERYQAAKKQKATQQVNACSCTYYEVGYGRYKKIQKIQCQRCRNVHSCQQRVTSLEGLSQERIIADFAQYQFNIYGFFNNIPSDILGLMKITYEGQIHPTQQRKQQLYNKNFFTKSYSELTMFSEQVKKGKINLSQNYTKPAKSFVTYPSKQIKVAYRGVQSSSKVSEELLQPQKYEPNLFQNSHQFMVNTPKITNSSREHEAYAKINLKKKDEMIDQYLQMASIRVANHTELLMLTQKIKNRQLQMKFLIEDQKLSSEKEKLLYVKALVMLNSAACMQSFKYLLDGELIKYPIVQQCVVDFLKNYLNSWKFQDMYSLHINGIICSLMSKLFRMEHIVLEIAQKAFSDYQKNLEQNKSGDNKIKSQLAYFLHGAFSFFNEDITFNLDKRSIFLWAKLQLLYRINKVFSDQNIKDQRFRETMAFFGHYRERSIYNNIDNVTKYFKKYPQELGQIVKLIDSDMSPSMKWAHSPDKGDYIFMGNFENKTYELNFFTGILLKNGGQLAGLPEMVKKDRYYISIFGQNRDLQVYPEKDGSLRTRTDFSDFFPNQPGKIIFFEFKIVKSDVIIRKIMKKGNKQWKYVMIPQTVVNQSNFQMPQLYLKVHFAWFCLQEGMITFRSKKLQQIRNVCLIILVRKSLDKLQIFEARIIEKNLKLQSLQTLKQPKSTDMFDLLVFSAKSAKISKAIQALASIENPAYILHISSPNRQQQGPKRNSKFWLHRYNLKFTLSNKVGLQSDNYQGYVVSQRFDSNEYLPWSPEDKIKCLMLQKVSPQLRFAKNHNYLALIPDTHVAYSKQKAIIPLGANTQMKVFSYEIHDHFQDLRGKSMMEQLHLACLAAAGYTNKLRITNEQYAIYVLRSCVGIRPLSKQEQAKLQNILSNSIELNQYIITLMCQVIYQSSKLVHNILPYYKKSKQKEIPKKNLFQNQAELVQNCKYMYKRYVQQQKVSIRSKLSPLQLKILSLFNYDMLNSYGNSSKSKWQAKYPINLAITENYETNISSFSKQLDQSYQLKRSIVKQINETPYQKGNQQQVLTLEGRCKMSSDQRQQISSSLKSYASIKKKLNSMQISTEERKEHLKKLNNMEIIINKNSLEILRILQDMQKGKQKNLDFITRKRSSIQQMDFTGILCHQEKLNLFYPESEQPVNEKFKYAISLWMQHKIQENSLQRIRLILNEEQLDKISLLRQIESPRDEIKKNVSWMAFEMEMKTQIWLSQFETFKLLSENKSGVVTQLNMGEGKTQIIIPMIVLNQIYIKKCQIPRVNILTPLYHEAQQNYYKFLSITGFRLHLLPICFNRQVEISAKTINRLQYALDLYTDNSFVLVDRDSTLSMVLKMRQEYGFRKAKMDREFILDQQCHKKDRWIFRNLKIIDIFDEVDALMTAKKSFVYAIGNSSTLPHRRIRFEYSSLFIDIILKDMLKQLIGQDIATLQQCYDNAASSIFDGKYPKGLRFLPNKPEKILQFRQRLVNLFFDKYSPPQFEFYKRLDVNQKESLILYCISQIENETRIPSHLSKNVHNQIYIVRGLLAYGVIEHCLSLRNGVDYGVPGIENLKRVGVPYEAADVPSKRSEYSHPEVATILSYLSYFNKGLTFKQFEEALRCLLKQTTSSQQRNYNSWIKCISNQALQPVSAKNVKQINQESVFQKQELFHVFQNCRATIVFWLVHCVFPTDLAQYTKSITSSSWDLADSKRSIGFSGTKDSHWLFPEYLYLKESKNDEINGTDGKMIQLMLENTKDVVEIKDNNDDLWKRYCQTSLQLKCGCLIDAGAILAGKSLQKQIVPWISNHPLFKQLYFKGISYCNQNGVWKVYDSSTHAIISRQTGIPEHETFVIFDEARTRGADIKLKTDTIAALSLGPNMAKDKLMQAVGRLRKFGRNQKIYILSTLQNYNKITGLSLKDTVYNKTRSILQWVCRNSIIDNKKMLYPNSKLAWIHFNNTKSKEEVVVQQFDPSLKKMYEGSIQFDTIQNLNREMAYEHINRYGSCQLVIYLQQNIDKFGDNYMVRCQSLEDICERQIEMIEQAQRTAQIETANLEPVAESSIQQIYNQQLSTIDIRLHRRLLFTANFLQCTKSKSLYSNKKKEEQNQLCLIHFALINPFERTLTVVTQREAHLKLQSGVKFLGPASLQQVVDQQFLVRFEDLSINSQCIRRFGLEQVLTDAQFFNGSQNFEDKDLLMDTIQSNEQALPGIKLQQILCHFLERRRTVQDKYMCSHLQTIFKRLINAK